MNNSKLAIDSMSLELEEPKYDTDGFKEREQKLVRIIEALGEVEKSKGWSSLRKELFDELPATVERQISTEARKLNPDTNKLNRLSGELKWAERFVDLGKLREQFRVELTNIRQRLYGTS